VAHEIRTSPASLLHHYGSTSRVIEVAARVWARHRLEEIRFRRRSEQIHAFLPADLDGVVDARAWEGWVELGRTHEAVARTVSESAAWERSLLEDVTGCVLSEARLDVLTSVVGGLRAAISGSEAPLRLDRARLALTTCCTLLLAGAGPPREISDHRRWVLDSAPIRV
jgi:AcrR family transcriptional regulator